LIIVFITHTYIPLLHFTNHYRTHQVFSFCYTLHQPLPGSGFQLRAFSFRWISELPQASTTSFSQKLLTTEPQRLPNLLQFTHQPTNTSLTDSSTYWHGPRRKHRFSIALQLLFSGDVFQCCVRSHRHGPRRKYHSYIAYGPLPINGQLLWLHNSCFEWICHNTFPLPLYIASSPIYISLHNVFLFTSLLTFLICFVC
jgi:hypothetical protein